MASVSGKFGEKLVGEVIANDGAYEDDPLVIAIFQYQTPEGARDCWSVCYSERDIRNTLESPFVINPKQVFGVPTTLRRIFQEAKIWQP